MKYLPLIGVIWIINSLTLHAMEISNCHSNCFESKARCNAENSHSFNSCHEALSACKMSCNSGKRHNAYYPDPLIEMKIDPVFERISF